MKFKTLLVVLLFLSTNAGADDFDFGDESTSEQTDAQNDSGFTFPLRGKISLDGARQTAKPWRWVRLGPSLQTIVDWKTDFGQIYIEGTASHNAALKKEEFPDEIVERYENEAVLREGYYKKAYSFFTLTIGQQIIVWGKGDFLSVLDVVSPADRSEFFFAKPEEARLGQLAIRADVWIDSMQVSLVAIPKPVMNRVPIEGHPYGQRPDIDPEKVEKTEGGIRINKDINAVAIGLVGGRFHRRDPLLSHEPIDPSTLPVDPTTVDPALPPPVPEITAEYEVYDLIGLAFSVTSAPFLYKAEVARLQSYPFQNVDDMGLPVIETSDVTTGMVGIEYSSNIYGTVGIESNLFSPDRDDGETFDSESMSAVTWSKSYLNDDLSLGISHIMFESVKNQLTRFDVGYLLSNNLKLKSQYTRISIESDKPQYRAIENFDRFDFSLSYAFDASR